LVEFDDAGFAPAACLRRRCRMNVLHERCAGLDVHKQTVRPTGVCGRLAAARSLTPFVGREEGFDTADIKGAEALLEELAT
jgi:hypothetical protein